MSTIAELLERARLSAPISRQGGALTIVPIHLEPNGGGDGGHKRDYVPLGEAVKGGRAQITEISESGSVPLLAIRNSSDLAVFILDGEELKGAKQNRIVNLSILVPSRTVLPIPVSCVERGRWSYRTRDFDVSPNAMFAGGRAQQMSSVTRCMMASDGSRRDGDQRRVWSDVDEMLTAFGAASPTAAMHDLYEASRQPLDDVLRGLAPLPEQTGAMFAVGGRVVGMELFETPDTLATYFPQLVRSYALDALRRGQGATDNFASSDADAFLADVKRASPRRFKAIGLGDDLRFAEDDLVGGALLLDDRVVHLAAFRSRDRGRDRAWASPGPTTGVRPIPIDTWWTRVKRWFHA